MTGFSNGVLTLASPLTSGNGGTGNGFSKLSGAASTEKTYTLPNATCNVLTDNAAVTVAQGGTGRTAAYAFSAYKSSSTSNVTGDSTSYTPIFDTELNDTGSWYNNSTGIATAPLTAIYSFSAAVDVNNLASGNTSGSVRLETTSRTFYGFLGNPWALCAPASTIIPVACSGISLVAGDTIKISTNINGGTKIVSIYGDGSTAAATWFSGVLN